jgi:hypothetical protein
MMKMLMEDIRLALRQMMRSSDAVMTVLPVLALGIALNIVALNVVDSVRVEMGGQQMARAACERSSSSGSVQRVMAPLQKMMGSGQHRWCSARSWMKERQTQVMQYKAEAEQMVYCALGQKDRC